jgi:hypothetical protein
MDPLFNPKTPMKLRYFLTSAACATLFFAPLTRILAEDSTSAPAAAAPAKPQPSVDPAKVEWNTARRKAMEDPTVKAAMDAARTAQMDANKKMLEKIREIDPALGPAVDKEEERMKPRAPMAPRPKASPKAAKKTAAKTPAATKTDESKPDATPTPQ